MPGHQASLRLRLAATVLSLAASLVLGLFGCAEASDRIQVSGNVDDDLVTAQAPQIEIAGPDLNAGFANTGAGTPRLPATGGQAVAPSSPDSAAATLWSWHRVATVEVREGDQVQAGQVLVRFDSELLRANIGVARADARVAASQVPVLDSAIDETFDKERDIKSALRKINKAIRQLQSTRTKLSVQLAQARRQLPQLEAQRAQVETQRDELNGRLRQVNQQLVEIRRLAQLSGQRPNTSVPATTPAPPNREQLLATILELQRARNQLQTGLNQLNQADSQLTAAIIGLRNGIPRLERAIRQIGDGLAEARTQRTKLRKARSKIIDARAELRRTRKLAVLAADAATVGIDLAENQKLLSTVTAPASGVVVEAATVGEVVATGATIATIRQGSSTSITTWLTPAQVAQICLGSQASVHADWMTGQALGAAVTLIGDRADYPPTAFATDEVHLTRAIPVRLTQTRSLGQPQPLPPGAPVDIEIVPRSNDHNCSTATTSR
jgi:multidrug efflux pump subunit AcrA (membrane-fusion protein)